MPEMLPIVCTIADLRAEVAAWRSRSGRIALVPTMGALHTGHLALIAAARQQADRVVASIFVNPAQFGPHEDFDRYPRDQASDAAALAGAGCDLLYAPEVSAMYPAGFATTVSVATLANRLCGAARPGHFDGVATVVTKLLLQATPDVALFGEKDWQQLTIIRRLARDLDLPVEIAGVPIVRDADGLALSSRNRYLTPAERVQALTLPHALVVARAALLAGGDVATTLTQAHAALRAGGFHRVDYVALTGTSDLEPLIRLERPARLLAAAWLGTTRLIDNVGVG
jgi:pantoate--beta-alanine ligase